jgi:hypothetical protein
MSRRFEITGVSLVSILFAVIFSFPLLREIGLVYNIYDWDALRDLDWIAVHIVTTYHQLPLWSPFQCGGLQLLANPEARILTPFFPLHLIFGSAVGINLEIPIHLAIAWAGGYVLGRVLNFGPLASAGCATVFPSSSWYYLRACAGGLHFLAFAYSPWIVAFTLLSIQRRRLGWAAAVGAVMGLAFLEGGVYPVTDTGLLIALLSLYLAVEQRSFWPLEVCLVAALFAGAFAAPKVLPMLSAGQSRATGADQEWIWFSEYFALLFSRTQDCYRWSVWCGVGSMPFCMIAAYLSPAFVALGLIGIYAAPRRCLPWIALIVIFFILAMGNYFGPYSPWVILHMLPVFSWVRIVPRFFIMLVFCVGVLTGFGLEMLSHRTPILIALGVLLLAAGTIDSYLVGPPNLVNHTDPQPPLPRSPMFRQYEDVNDLQTVRVNEANMGATRCPTQMAIRDIVSPSNRPGYRGEQYLLGAGSLRLATWSPEILVYDVDVKSPTVLEINQNYDTSWKVHRGRGEVFSDNGLLAVRLSAGAQQIELRYRSDAFVAGLLIALAAFLLALLLTTYEVRARRAHSPSVSE